MKNALLFIALLFAGQLTSAHNLFMGHRQHRRQLRIRNHYKRQRYGSNFHTVYSFDQERLVPDWKNDYGEQWQILRTTELGGMDDSCTV